MNDDKTLIEIGLAGLVRNPKAHSGVSLDFICEALTAIHNDFDDLSADDPKRLDRIAQQIRDRLPPQSAPSTTSRPGQSSRSPAPPVRGGRPVQSGAHQGQQSVGTTPAEQRGPNGRATAPYRFVVLPNEVVTGAGAPPLDTPVPDGYTARIKIRWAAETPLLVSEQVVDPLLGENRKIARPMRLGRSGPHMIPGTTLKGMIRAAVEIVAHAKIGTFANRHHRYALRDFNHPYYADQQKLTDFRNVKAGFLHWERGDGGAVRWMLKPLQANDWACVLIEGMLKTDVGNWRHVTRNQWVEKTLTEKYELLGTVRDGAIGFSKTVKITDPTEVRNEKNVVVRHAASLGGHRDGILVFSGGTTGARTKKQYEYVFYDHAAPAVEIKKPIVELFLDLHCKRSKNKREPEGSWAELIGTLQKNGRIPVFYVGDPREADPKRFFFGLTRLFKIPHEFSVSEVLARQQKHNPGIGTNKAPSGEVAVTTYRSDFVENLFGFVVGPDDIDLPDDVRRSPKTLGLKGRVAFSLARNINPDQVTEATNQIEAVTMAPRASFAPFYLRGEGVKDYSDKTVTVAGRKRYLPRHGAGRRIDLQALGAQARATIEAATRAGNGTPPRADTLNAMRFLVGRNGSEPLFDSEIRLHNVKAEEIGAVLFALTHGGDPEKPYRHMIGRGKMFGAGQMRVVTVRLDVEANVPRAGDRASASALLIKPPEQGEYVSGVRGFVPRDAVGDGRNVSHVPFLDAFETFMRAQAGLASYPRVPAVEEFLGSSDPGETARLSADPNGALAYMDLSRFAEVRGTVARAKGAKKNDPEKLAAHYPGERDGRLLAAPRLTPDRTIGPSQRS